MREKNEDADVPLTAAEKRVRFLAKQKRTFVEQRPDSTRIDALDYTAPDFFTPFWSLFYQRLLIGTRRSFSDQPATVREREWLLERVQNNSCTYTWVDAVRLSHTCTNREHLELAQRDNASQFDSCPNAAYYDEPRTSAARKCLCHLRNTVILCNDLSHSHTRVGWQQQIDATHTDAPATYRFESEVQSIDRFRDRLTFGSFNQNIVATEPFGPASHQRWEALLRIAARHCTPTHSISLFNTLDARLKADSALSATRRCLDCFAYKTLLAMRRGQPRDRRLSLIPETIFHLKQTEGERAGEPRFVRDAGYLDANHPFHTRFDACDANETTMAVLLFIEATGNSMWLRVWQVWVTVVAEHCNTCIGCRQRLIEFLACVTLLGQITPSVLPSLFAQNIERLLKLLRNIN